MRSMNLPVATGAGALLVQTVFTLLSIVISEVDLTHCVWIDEVGLVQDTLLNELFLFICKFVTMKIMIITIFKCLNLLFI